MVGQTKVHCAPDLPTVSFPLPACMVASEAEQGLSCLTHGWVTVHQVQCLLLHEWVHYWTALRSPDLTAHSSLACMVTKLKVTSAPPSQGCEKKVRWGPAPIQSADLSDNFFLYCQIIFIFSCQIIEEKFPHKVLLHRSTEEEQNQKPPI